MEIAAFPQVQPPAMTTAFFVGGALPTAPPRINATAVVWGSGPAAPCAAYSASDPLATITTTDIHLLRSLRVISGSFVVVSTREKTHVARLELVKGADADDAQGHVILPPLLAFNLGLPLHALTGQTRAISPVTLRAAELREIGLNSDTVAFRKLSDQSPAVARKAVIAPLLVSSLACRDHAVMQQADGLLQAIRSHFETPQVLQSGDIFAITLQEATPSASTTFETVTIPADAIAGSGRAQQATRVTLPPSLVVDTSVVFFRVESMEAGTASPLALSVSSDTELLQVGSISAGAPDEEAVKQCWAATRESQAKNARSFVSSAPLEKLFEMLQPSQLCAIPVSVLLAGPSGVGKTTLVHDVAKLLGVHVVEVPFTELLTAGQSELLLVQNMREQVAKAQALAPCLLYISHFFAIDKQDEEAELRMASALSECLRALSQTSVQQKANIPLIACVDDLSEVPKFVRQCFLYELPMEAPDQKARLAFLEQVTSIVTLDADVDLAHVAQVTAGRTCGELSALLTDACSRAMKRLTESSPTSLLDNLVADVVGEADAEAERCTIKWVDLEAALKHQQSQASAAKMGGAASIPNVKWEDVGGLDDVKDEILDVVQLPIKHPELFASGVRQRSGILLYGPPGTGKTLLAKAIATECNMNFLSVKGPELLNMYIGESEKNVRQVFAKARSCRPCILFFDELDSLAPMRGRGSDSGGVMDRVVSQLLTEIDGLSGGSSGSDQVFVIGATNRPDLIESGLLRPGRFDRLLYLGICTEKQAQRKVVEALTRKFALAEDVDIDHVVNECPLNFTGADFYALCSGALAAALKDRVDELDRQLAELQAEDCYSSTPVTLRVLLNRLTPDELKVRVAQRHFLTSLSQVVPSVSEAEIAHYERLRDQYSSRQAS